jgi:outer membrane protein OmpA-like peptidoglycan-associated protein
VEGEEGEGERICGGLPLKHVKISVLRELDLSCDTILPQAGFKSPPEFRPTAPYRPGRGVATDRSYPRQEYKRPPPPSPPFEARSYRINFGFDDDFLHLAEGIDLSNVLHYFEDIKASRLTVEVHRDRVELTNGTILEEDAVVAQRRANRMLNLFTTWGIPASKIETRLVSQPAPNSSYLTLTVQP